MPSKPISTKERRERVKSEDRTDFTLSLSEGQLKETDEHLATIASLGTNTKTPEVPKPPEPQYSTQLPTKGRVTPEKKISVSVSVRPSLLNAAKEIVYLQRSDISNLFGVLLEQFVSEHIGLLDTGESYCQLTSLGTVEQLIRPDFTKGQMEI